VSAYTVIGDPHAKPNNLDKINTLFDIVEDLGLPTIWLGDLLDTKEVVRGKCLNTYIRRFRESKLQHYVLVGNHDWFNLDCKEHSLEPLKALPNVRVVDDFFILDKGQTVLLAYKHNQDLLKAHFSNYKGKTVFCHADIRGFDYGNGLVSTDGLELADVDGVNVISGHYHKFQEIGNVTYLGTPFSHSFGESNQDKYIAIFRPGQKLELIETPFPKHVTLELDCSKYDGHEAPQDDYMRVILRGTQEEIDRVMRFDEVKYIEQPTAAAKAATINESESPEVQFSKWAKDIKGYSDEILKLGLEVLSDV
jgi:hypothetical protein